MNTLTKKDGVYYTQNIENLPIEERVFFREGKGMSAKIEVSLNDVNMHLTPSDIKELRSIGENIKRRRNGKKRG